MTSNRDSDVISQAGAAHDGVREPPLLGKVAIVTGSTSGIGRATAAAFASQGARVVLNSVSSAEAGHALAAELGDATYVQGSISDPETAGALVRSAMEAWGSVHYLINNAGITEFIPLSDLERAGTPVWERIFDVNVMGAWRCIQEAVPLIHESGGGAIVNVTSIAGVRAMGSSLPYAASKAAMNHVTRLLATAVGPDITVNAVAPGLIDTPWTAEWTSVKEDVSTRAPAGRVGRPEDVADACLALVRLPYVTGNVLMVDGGLHLR